MATRSCGVVLSGALVGLVLGPPWALAQGAAPIPGTAPPLPTQGAPRGFAPTPGTPVNPVAPAPGSSPAESLYHKLPLNLSGAAGRLEELRNLMGTMSAKDFQESLNQYCEWLQDMADAHWRVAQSFAKHDVTKPLADPEKLSALKFGSLRRQSMLLKAEFLIGQRRSPEALAPLIEIVTSEPTTETGRSAYQLLKQIGFVEKIKPEPQSVPAAEAPAVQQAAPTPGGSSGVFVPAATAPVPSANRLAPVKSLAPVAKAPAKPHQ
jgi:hypothetical protein